MRKRLELREYSWALTTKSLAKKADTLGGIIDERRRLRAGSELLTVVLQKAEELEAIAWTIRAELGLQTRPDE